MTISEHARHELHQKLEQLLGPNEAATLMEHLPPRGWADVATKSDLDHLAALTKGDIDHLAALTKADIERVEVGLGARIEAVEVRLGTRIDGVEVRLGTRIDGVEVRLGARIDGVETRIEIAQRQTTETLYKELAAQTRTMVFACIGAVMTSTGLAFAAARV